MMLMSNLIDNEESFNFLSMFQGIPSFVFTRNLFIRIGKIGAFEVEWIIWYDWIDSEGR